jgi:hypothetical protein
MSEQHTPGPWTQHEGEVWAKNYGLISRSYYGKPDGEGAANARLIAAAPDLLHACRKAVIALAALSETCPPLIQEYEIVSAAIAKATQGETK